MFSIVNLARHIGVNPEMALRGTIRRFATRFSNVEDRLGPDLTGASLDELEAAWKAAKSQES